MLERSQNGPENKGKVILSRELGILITGTNKWERQEEGRGSKEESSRR